MASQLWRARPGAGEVTRIRRAITDYTAGLGVPQCVVDDVALDVSEVVTNSVLHGYPNGPDDGTITVEADVDGQQVTIHVVDDGVGLAPRNDSPGAGLGLAIANRLARCMVIETPLRGGTEVHMTFRETA
jgi:anti-sigma regulatory factor (Ser/Thr protein kinase)